MGGGKDDPTKAHGEKRESWPKVKRAWSERPRSQGQKAAASSTRSLVMARTMAMIGHQGEQRKGPRVQPGMPPRLAAASSICGSDHSPRVNRRKTGIFCGSPSLCTVAGRKPFFTLCEDSTTLTRPAQQFPPRLPFTHHRPGGWFGKRQVFFRHCSLPLKTKNNLQGSLEPHIDKRLQVQNEWRLDCWIFPSKRRNKSIWWQII